MKRIENEKKLMQDTQKRHEAQLKMKEVTYRVPKNTNITLL